MAIKVIYENPSNLKPYHRNAKQHSMEQVAELAKSILNFGFDQPIVISPTYEIIKGHGRWQAAIKLGMTEVPVIIRDDLTEDSIRLSRLADNDVVGLEWDNDTLVGELTEIKDAGFDMDLACVEESEYENLLSAAVSSSISVGDVILPPIKTKYDCPKCGYRW
jgi:ParB-like chromosome segregation protein Spo0J